MEKIAFKPTMIKCAHCGKLTKTNKYAPKKKFCSTSCGSKNYYKRIHSGDPKLQHIKVRKNKQRKEWRKNNPEKERMAVKRRALAFNKRMEDENYYNKYYANKKRYRNDRYENDVLFKIALICRGRIRKFLKIKNMTKRNKTFKMIGCTPQELKKYLEKKFKKGMNWKNHSLKGWHIDHIIPLNAAQTQEDIEKLCHYTNLQPLWAKDNITKQDKL